MVNDHGTRCSLFLVICMHFFAFLLLLFSMIQFWRYRNFPPDSSLPSPLLYPMFSHMLQQCDDTGGRSNKQRLTPFHHKSLSTMKLVCFDCVIWLQYGKNTALNTWLWETLLCFYRRGYQNNLNVKKSCQAQCDGPLAKSLPC